MTCAEAQELITALADEELLDPERSSLEAHLKECAELPAYSGRGADPEANDPRGRRAHPRAR